MAHNFELRPCPTDAEWLKASGQRLLNEQPGMYAHALTLVKKVPGYADKQYGYTSFAVHIKPGCDAFVHPGPHNGRSKKERAYLILKPYSVIHKPANSMQTVSVADAAVLAAGRHLRGFMVGAMEYTEDRWRAEAYYDDDSDEDDKAPDVNIAALVGLLGQQLQRQAVLEHRVRELEARR